ncbi:putative methyltransferase-domain-containing protein [Hypoxylon sp. FL1284]|nr:putative methyltransferase-domain-containing protein [Hypoxylon sp. FL1284]
MQDNPKVGDDSINRFCRQYLQLERDLDYPPADFLREAEVQDDLYRSIFAEDALPYPPPRRYQLRVLKELMSRIESSIEDWDSHGVSDDLMTALSTLLALPLPSEFDAAQQKSYVTYTLSLLDPSTLPVPLPAQITLLESRNLISAAGTTGLRTWEAALHLGQFLTAKPSLIRRKHVLELGAGTGYLSILCAKFLAAATTIASDGSDDVVSNLPENFFLNGLQESKSIRAMDVKWGHALVGTEDEHWNGGGPVDVVLGADITYDRSVIPALVATLDELVAMFPHVAVLISATERNRETFDVFLKACEGTNFHVEQIDFEIPPRPGQRGPFYNDQVPIRICKIVKYCQAGVRFTTQRWEVELGKPLTIAWADANGAVNVTLVEVTSEGLDEIFGIVANYTENTFTWTPGNGLGPGRFALRICDDGSIDESPRLSLSGSSLERNTARRDAGETDDSRRDSDDDGLPPGAAAGISVGSTLGGVLLLAVVAVLIYRGRQGRAKPEHQEAGGRDEGKGKQKETPA